MKALALLVLLGLTTNNVFAQSKMKPLFNFTRDTTGSELFEYCQNDHANCESTLSSLEIGFKIRELSEREKRYCPPKELSPLQTRLVVMKYLGDNPAKLHKPAVDLARSALRLAFPCQNSN
jgi:Rap1a immunity proteins